MTAAQLAAYLPRYFNHDREQWCQPHPATVRSILSELVADEIVASDSTGGRGRELIYFLTARALKDAFRNGFDPVTKNVIEAPPSIRNGVFAAHHRAVNDAGLAFRRAAYERDEIAEWDHEVRYPNDKKPLLKADAVLTYHAAEWRTTYFIELDRNRVEHSSPSELIEKIRNYAQLMRRGAAWSDRHDETFPTLLVVLTGRRDKVLARIAAVAEAVDDDDKRPATGLVPAGDLAEHGPFAPIFHEVGDIEHPVNAFGETATVKCPPTTRTQRDNGATDAQTARSNGAGHTEDLVPVGDPRGL